MKIPQMIEERKHVYGTYSVMALLNISTVLNHIQKLADIEGEFGEECEDYWFHPVFVYLQNVAFGGEDSLSEKTQFIVDKLIEYFPFLKIMLENQRMDENRQPNAVRRLGINTKDMFHVLNNAFRVLKTYRDTTTHFLFEDGRWDDGSSFLEKNEQRLSQAINKYYEIALRNTKEKYGYTTENLAFIQDNRYKRVFVDGRRTMRPDLDFFLSMLSFNEDRTRKYHLSAVGVAQLICLFLNKQYINIFLSKLPIYASYGRDSEEGKIIRRSMGIHSIRLPKERIQSEKSEMSIAMDMLNELKRCPMELFDTLSYADQCRFRIISEDYNEVLQKRNTDRFVPLALQYIDYNKLFSLIRFHVNMGKVRYLFAAEKHCIDGQSRVRVLEQPVNGFGRIQEMEEKRAKDGTFADSGIQIRDFEHVKRDDANPDNYPYMVDTFTNYLLKNNKVEMSFVGESKIPKIIHQGDGKYVVDNPVPSCRMSTLELPAMMFHMHLLGVKKTEKRIWTVFSNYNKLFTALKEGTLTKENITSFGIGLVDMPKKVIEAVNGTGKNGSYLKHVQQSIEALLDETQWLMERLKNDKQAVNSKQNKMGKPGFRQIKLGKLAEFLAKDIVKFQNTAREGEDYGTDRLTGLNYRVMQATIATYDNRMNPQAFEQLSVLFKNAGLTVPNGKNNHPFLFRVLFKRPNDTIELYENYLDARKKYLLNLKKEVDSSRCKEVSFINCNRNKWMKRDAEYYVMMGEIYADELPIELPRQMFDEEIKEALQKKPEMSGVDFEHANVTYLIGEYLKRVHQDDFQNFYTWQRNYRYMDMLKCQVDEKNSLCKSYTTIPERDELWKNRSEYVESYRRWAFQKNKQTPIRQRISDEELSSVLDKRISRKRNEFQLSEKMIRRFKVQDALLFLLAKDTMTQQIEFGGRDFKLKEITPDADKGILSEIMPMDFFFVKNGKRYTIHSNGMKIKNFGDFYRIIHDKRLSSLLKILSTVTIEKEDLEEEFKNYDTSRPKMVSLVLDFEKIAFDNNEDLKSYVRNGEHFDFSSLLSELKLRGELSIDEAKILSQIRNAFDHNAYPKNVSVIDEKNLPEIAKRLLAKFEETAGLES